MRASQAFWGCKPLHYLRYGLYRSDRPLGGAELLSYIPEFFFYSLFLAYHDADEEPAAVIRDKIRTERLFRDLGIRQPPTLGLLVRGRLCERTGGRCPTLRFSPRWRSGPRRSCS